MVSALVSLAHSSAPEACWSTGNDHDVQPRVGPPVTCAVIAIDPTRIVSPSLDLWSTRAGW